MAVVNIKAVTITDLQLLPVFYHYCESVISSEGEKLKMLLGMKTN